MPDPVTATAMSGLPSPSKSATSTSCGLVPSPGNACATSNERSPLPARMLIPLTDPWWVTTASRTPLPSRSASSSAYGEAAVGNVRSRSRNEPEATPAAMFSDRLSAVPTVSFSPDSLTNPSLATTVKSSTWTLAGEFPARSLTTVPTVTRWSPGLSTMFPNEKRAR